MSLKRDIEQMFFRELQAHGRAFVNNEALENVCKRSLTIDGLEIPLHYNPAREASVMAKVDEKSLRERKCFLCPDGVAPEQLSTEWDSPFGTKYLIRVNPFPIFDKHFTVSISKHIRQHISGRFLDMLSLAQELGEYVVFYNGPKCGASAPDHQHFQAIPKGNLPIENMVRRGEGIELLSSGSAGRIFEIKKFVSGAYLIVSDDVKRANSLFDYLYWSAPIKAAGEWEPRLNVVSWYEESLFYSVLFFREESRPECFWSENSQERILFSPASVEMSGVAIVSSKDSYDKITQEALANMITEVSLNKQQAISMSNKAVRPQEILKVGIFSEEEICFIFNKPYQFNGKGYEGEQVATFQDGKILFDGEIFDEIYFASSEEEASFVLQGVTIGVNFHWERKEDQTFAGNLKLIVENQKITAINVIGLEDYLFSVISSEMSATASKQLLKAHAVVSRSWLLAQIIKNKEIVQSQSEYTALQETEEEMIKWYDREDHINFDVCADDHCQRYQGLVRASTTPTVREVIDETWGEVLMYDGEMCDARFSKCCGGQFEEFEYCWENKHYPYLSKKMDILPQGLMPDLTVEENAVEWIKGSPDAFCNTSDKKILSQVLNNYDQETVDFYRWTVEYGQKELSELIKSRSGVDYGDIIDLIPIARGTSGRIWKLKIVGTKVTKIIGKELEVRRTLSPSHLYSSAFVVEKSGVCKNEDGVELPEKITLRGAGWGHGAGLCQIGAAVMGEKGYSYDEILLHYFTGASIIKNY